MGICGSTVKTDPVRWAKPVDEVQSEQYIVPLEMILMVIGKKYSNPVDTIVNVCLKNENAFAANFQLKLDAFDDLYHSHRHYKIIQITNYHKHCDKNGSQYDFRFGSYLNLIGNGVDSSTALLPKCKCVLTKTQFEFYTHLVSKL